MINKKNLSKVERRVLDAIDFDSQLTFLDELVSVPSLSGEETEIQKRVALHLIRMGMDVDVWEIDFDALKEHPDYSAEIDRDRGLGVVGTMGANVPGSKSLIFNGHVDVVPSGDEKNWKYPAWRATVDNDRVFGRGSLDMKGGLSCAVYAAKAILDAGIQLKGRLHIESVIGEEDGGCGALATVLKGYRADAAVIVEPTEMTIATAQAGSLNFRLIVPGLSAHGCMREEGVSALEKFLPLHDAIMALERERNLNVDDPLFSEYELPYPISIGIVQAGNWPSSVPERLVCEGRYGIRVDEELDSARKELEKAIDKAAINDGWLRENRPNIEWWGGQFAPAVTPSEAAYISQLSSAFADVSGNRTRIRGVTYGSDMRHLVNAGGIPSVLFGPGDVRKAHQPDEFVPANDLLAVTRTLALMAIRFCGVKSYPY